MKDNDTLHDQNTGALDGCSGTAFDVTVLVSRAALQWFLTLIAAPDCPILETGCAGSFDIASNALAAGSALGSEGRHP